MYHTQRKGSIKKWIGYFSLICFLFAFQKPTLIFADPCSCILINDEDAQRTKTATVAARATVIALIGAVAWLAFGTSGGHKHHHSSSSSCSSDDSYYDSYYYPYSHHWESSCSSNYSSDSSHSHHRHHHHHHHHHRSSSSFNDETNFGISDLSEQFTDPQLFDRFDIPRSRKSTRSKHSTESKSLSGVLITYPKFSSVGSESMTAFVRLPDGTTQTLGNVSFSSGGSSSISYGPFTQKGIYTFGLSIQGGNPSSGQIKIASLQLNVNGSIVNCHDFFIPSHCPTHYELTPYEYDHN